MNTAKTVNDIKWAVIIQQNKDDGFSFLAPKSFLGAKDNRNDVALFGNRDDAREAARIIRKNYNKIFRVTPTKVTVEIKIVLGSTS